MILKRKKIDDKGFPPIWAGYKRQWVKCKEGGRVAYYDYVPFSLSNPVMTLPCGHGASQRFTDATEEITPDEALQVLYKEERL